MFEHKGVDVRVDGLSKRYKMAAEEVHALRESSWEMAFIVQGKPREPEGIVKAVAETRPGALRAARDLLDRGMVVVTIIVILISMAIPIYNRSIIRAKESVLHNNLFTLRTVIDNYTYDKQKAPQQLQDLVTEGYLQKVPIDPMIASNQTWRTIMEDASQSVNQSEPGIFDVKSGSDGTALDGTRYSDW